MVQMAQTVQMAHIVQMVQLARNNLAVFPMLGLRWLKQLLSLLPVAAVPYNLVALDRSQDLVAGLDLVVGPDLVAGLDLVAALDLAAGLDLVAGEDPVAGLDLVAGQDPVADLGMSLDLESARKILGPVARLVDLVVLRTLTMLQLPRPMQSRMRML